MERIELKDVGLGFGQCRDINKLVKDRGETLLSDLANTIVKLQEHWTGSDATKHINNLITVKDALGALLKDAKGVTSFAGACISAVQEVIKANGGVTEIGERLSDQIADVVNIAKSQETKEYHVDPSTNTDYNELVDECTRFDKFVADFNSQKDELFSNWSAGARREDAVKSFNEFIDNSDTYKKYMTDARDNLEIAVSNISQLG